MSKIKFHIDNNVPFREGVKSVLEEFAHYCGHEIDFSSTAKEDVIHIGTEDSDQLIIDKELWTRLQDLYIKRAEVDEDMNLIGKDGRKDLLATAFYFMHCIWERDEEQLFDNWGRASFEGSIWDSKGFSRPVTVVNNKFKELAGTLDISIVSKPSCFYLSHDIDAVNSAWLEDGKAAVKAGYFGAFLKMFWRHLMKDPNWFNFKDIAILEESHGARSVFFWLTEQGKVEGIGQNADYDISGNRFIHILEWLESKGFENGLHRSISSTSMNEELHKLKASVQCNRYHYLKFTMDHLIREVRKTELKADASLGYAKVIGYRNGYSLPFRPFDFERGIASEFIEIPLTIMDASLSRYQRLSPENAWVVMKDFIDENPENSVISVLWHNTHFTEFKYKGYREVYTKLLKHIENKEKVLTSTLLEEYPYA